MDTLVIREVAGEDRAALQRVEELEVETFGRGGLNLWALAPLSQHGKVYVGEEGGEIRVYALLLRNWEESPRRAYLFSYAVARDHQGRGLGSRFLELLMATLKGEGTVALELTVAPTNVKALHLYHKKYGFEIARVLPSWYGDGEDRYYLSKQL